MAAKQFNSIQGYTVGDSPINIADANANVYANNFSVSGTASFSGISGVKIPGGTSGDFIQTDGAGNLTYTTVTPISGYSGYSGYSGIGTSGYSGYSGYSGIGTSGYSGYSGYSGIGTSGYSGYSGSIYGSRVVALADATSVTFDADTTDTATQDNTQATGTLTINAPSGSPTNAQKILFRLKSTNVQTFSWNSAFQGSTDLALPTASTGSSKYDYMGFIYNSTNSKWQLIASVFGF